MKLVTLGAQMNYVFSDGEGTADNNSGADYATPISGDMTLERWVEEAPLRAVSSPVPRFAAQSHELQHLQNSSGTSHSCSCGNRDTMESELIMFVDILLHLSCMTKLCAECSWQLRKRARRRTG